MMRRLLKLARSGAAVSAASIYLGVFCTLGLAFFGAWWFGDRVFGDIVIGNTAIILGAMLGQFGFSHGLVKLIGSYRATHDLPSLKGAIRYVPLFCTGTGAVLALLGFAFLCLPLGIEPATRHALFWAMPCIPVWTQMLLQQHVARGYQRMGLANLPSTVVHPLLLMAACWSMTEFQNASATFYFQAYLVLGLLTVLGLAVWLRLLPQLRELHGVRAKSQLWQWIVMSYPIGLAVGLNQVLQRSDVLVLATFVPKEIVAYYGLATRVTQGVGQCTIAFNRYWAAAFAGQWELRDIAGLQRSARRAAQLSTVVALSLAALLVLFGRSVFTLPGEDFVAAYPLMLILLAGQLTSAYFAANVTLLQMADQQWAATLNFALLLPPLIVAYFAFAPWSGAPGVAAVSSAGWIALSVLMAISCVKRLGVNPGAI
ncbi:MAG: lipopolysaccharide biosynthesis protein [Phycisphaeraceae bacterium]|nr:lipopolysaccharide biosynthesis protein [Phycisphaeraceae bacterium]